MLFLVRSDQFLEKVFRHFAFFKCSFKMIYEFFNAIVPFPKQYKKFTTFTREPSKYLDNDYSFFSLFFKIL